MESSLIDTALAITESLGAYLLTFFLRMLPQLVSPAFIATFLFFTLVIWIGMSGDDREPVASFSKAGVIAFLATFFMFSIITE